MSEMWGIFLAGNERSTVVVLKAYLDFFFVEIITEKVPGIGTEDIAHW